MAILLEDKTNVEAPTVAFPYGNVKDDDGSNNGTPLNKAVLADYWQFFAKMFAESGLTANGLPESDTDGFQYFEALVKAINNNNSAGIIETDSQQIVKTMIAEIGPWDMQIAANSITLASLGITRDQIFTPPVIVVQNDAQTERHDLAGFFLTSQVTQGSIEAITSTFINFESLIGGKFDSAAYSSVAINRGWITIQYIP